MPELSGHLKSTQLILSIIAGARINTLCQGLNHRYVVRVMPNTPVQIGEGISVWTATTEVTKPQKEWTSAILGAMGKEIYVDDEKYLECFSARIRWFAGLTVPGFGLVVPESGLLRLGF